MTLNETCIQTINSIFDIASKEERTMLYEHEVYEMLSAMGLSIPHYAFVQNPDDITPEILQRFGDNFVMKIVSPDIAHKQKLGGVKVVKNHDVLFARYVAEKMAKEVTANMSKAPHISGFIIVEFISFPKSLGYELLLGAKEDDAFGPVITISKGGDDAEFFAKYYDPANLFLPHLSSAETGDITKELKIRHKFEAIGHPEYMQYMARAASAVSALLSAFSPLNVNAKYHIQSLDINPLVFTEDDRFIAIDGYAQFKSAVGSKRSPKIHTENIKYFFDPKGVVVLGVSSKVEKYSMAKDIVHLLQDLGRDDIYCINPKGGEATIDGKVYPLYKSMDDLPCDVDLAVYAAPAKYIPSFFENLENRVPKSVVLIPGIPSDFNYSDFKKKLRSVIPAGVRVVGPNCMGVFSGPTDAKKAVNTLFIEEERLKVNTTPRSNTALLTQSGGMAITLVDKLENTPIFNSIVSFGNKFDVKIADLMAYFGNDQNTDVIALYVEGFDHYEGRLFFELTQKINKPVVVYKGGKTELGARAAASHTAAMTGDYDVLKAACAQCGAVLLDDADIFRDCLKTFSLLSKKKVTGRRIAAVLNAGFEATILSDELGSMTAAPLSDATRARLNEINTHGLVDTKNSILDVSPMTDDVMYGEFIRALMDDENVDAVVVGVVPHVENIKSTPDTCHDKDSLANITAAISEEYDKPLIVSVNAGEYYAEFVEIMEKAGLPVYDDIRSTARSLETFIDYRMSNQ